MAGSKTIAKNTLFLYFRMILVMGVSLFTSRIVLQELGVSDYGIYSLVGGIVALFGFFNAAMSSATQRYLSFDIGKEDDVQLQKTFTATLTIHFGIALLVLILAETIGLWYVNYKMVFPPERSFAVNVVYQFSVATALLGVVQVPYNALIIARERMNVYAYVSIVEVLLKLLIVFFLVFFGNDKLITYAILTFFVSFIIRIIYQMYCRRNFKESKYKFELDKAYYKELISYSGWNLFGNLAWVARGQGNGVVLNLFFGVVANASYGIMNMVGSLVDQFVANFQAASRPQIIMYYTQAKFKEMEILISRVSKFTFFLSILVIGPLIIKTELILELWLGDAPMNTVIFVRLCLINSLIGGITSPLVTGIQATGKIRKIQIAESILITSNIPISFILFKYNVFAKPEIILYIWLLTTCFIFLLRIYLSKTILNIDVYLFFETVLIRLVLVALFAILLGYILNTLFIENTLANLFMISISYCLILVFIVVYVGLNSNERKKIKELTISKYLVK